MLPLLSLSNLGNCCIFGYLTVGFVLGSTTYISPGRIIYLRRSSVVLEKVFLSKLPLLNCPKSGKCIFTTVSVVVQYFSVFHSEIALQTAVGLAPFWCIFTIDWAKENYFDLQLKPICYSDCELARVYDFKERISLGLISYFLCSCLLHILQLCSVLYTVYIVQCTAMTIILRIGWKRQWVCSKLWTSLVNMCLSLWVINHVLAL